jgi:adenine/guanine phosphoribosyltransferase-like PRPP-binding protein
MRSAQPLETLRRVGGYYACPKDEQGNRLGPLVGYAGRYQAPDGTTKQYVGDVYANWSRLEERPRYLEDAASQLVCAVAKLGVRDRIVYCGAPLGGMTLALVMALNHCGRYVFAEKKVTSVAAADSREQSILIFGRHEIHPGDNVVLVEDVLNNFSTTAAIADLVRKAGGNMAAIAAIMDRSSKQPDRYRPSDGSAGIPVIALVRGYIPQYRQDDPEVAADVAAGNVVWKPKVEWSRLMTAMDRCGSGLP